MPLHEVRIPIPSHAKKAIGTLWATYEEDMKLALGEDEWYHLQESFDLNEEWFAGQLLTRVADIKLQKLNNGSPALEEGSLNTLRQMIAQRQKLVDEAREHQATIHLLLNVLAISAEEVK